MPVSDIESRSANRRRRRRIWYLVLLALFIGGASWLAINRPWELKPASVEIEVVAKGPASRILAINGRVKPTEQVEVSSTVSGRILSVSVAEGQQVSQGTPLLVVDDTQQRATVAQVRSQLNGAQAQLDKAQVDLERAEALTATVSQRALGDSRLAVRTAHEEVDRLTALLAQAEDLLAQYVVKAPLDGTILSRGADAGQVVSSTTPLFLIADMASLHAEASVDELYASEMRRGLSVVSRPTGHSGVIEGEVIYVSPSVDATTGGRLVRVSLPGAGEANLPVGLTVMLNIVVEARDDAITIPRQALVAADQPAVFLIEDGRAVLTPVQYIDWPSDRLIVTRGLEGGERLIVDSKKVRADGALVAVRE
ncbi:efflux RND transporter periplasmic adaptor subunit [Devosia oryzisoli]|uniref:efflux RND transporter periplasmic adaptor subunit n=1 Tax=Devosia oryzisoli TaxID=2774138 RepID=UPI001AED35CB|nr:efflux RND transporter periplasmic adaptor subunit [Devosia oryzisoli]